MFRKNSPRFASRLLGLSLAVLGVGACMQGPTTTGGNTHLTTDGTSCPVAADIGLPALSDEEIAQVILSVNLGEIQQGELARQQATNSEVRRFAELRVQDHTAANQQLQARLQALGITPRENPLSHQLMAESNQLLTRLRSNVGTETFDLAYMDAQVSLHAQTLFLMDIVLQPQLRNAELRDFALTARGTVQRHLDAAVPLQKQLSPSP
jgi:putative membrane protein